MSELLSGLGFLPEELQMVETYADGTIIVPAVIAGEPARLMLDTGQQDGLVLSHAYVRERGLPYERESDRWGTATVTELSALGAARAPKSVPVRGGEEDTTVYYTAGTLGIQYVPGRLLAIDPVEWVLGISNRPVLRDAFSRARYRLPLCTGTADDLPLLSLEDAGRTTEQPVLLLDSSRASSLLSLEFANRSWTSRWRRRRARWALRRGGRTEIAWRFPGGERVCVDTFITARYEPGYGPEIGVDAIHGALGVDFLYRWLPVFDLSGRELALFDLQSCRTGGFG